MNKRIIIATTFRDFTGDENDEIQKLFLKSIKNQNYNNWLLVVTIFQEKKVKIVLNSMGINCKFFNSHNKGYKYSHTEVILNAIKEINFDDIIIWTTCDVIFEPNFFDNIIKHLPPKSFGICAPHIIYNNLGDYYKNINYYSFLFNGIDTVFFTADVINKDFINDLINYPNREWGLFEHFLSALGKLYANNLVNFYFLNKIRKINNPIKMRFNHNSAMGISYAKNWKTLYKFLSDKKLSLNFYHLFYCYKQFKAINGGNLRLYLENWKSFLSRDFFLSLIPKNLKIKLKLSKTAKFKNFN